MNEHRVRRARPVRARVIDNLQIVGQIEGKMVVGAAQSDQMIFVPVR